ncbi:MAG: hypothetical protein IPG10_18950 [Flavobacteriales bacterium]|nr:hypothetical protein [Flavobacteriales bacterium]
MMDIKLYQPEEGIVRVELFELKANISRPEYLCAIVAALVQFVLRRFTVELVAPDGSTIGQYTTESSLVRALAVRGIDCKN